MHLSTRAKIQLARQLRQRSTSAERKAWKLLRNRRMFGLKFRRQHPIKGFVGDFYCAKLRLVLELDGGIHNECHQAEYDQERTRILEAHDLTVIRIRNEDVSEATLRRLLSRLSRIPGEGPGGEGRSAPSLHTKTRNLVEHVDDLDMAVDLG